MASNKWTAGQLPDLGGQIVVVTGANSGLGFESTKALTKAGAHVVMACRNPEKGEAAVRELRKAVPRADLELMELDLASLESVRRFAESFLRRYDQLHVLMNNAGVMATPFTRTEEGFEQQFGINHLGHFLLTKLLWERLATTPGSRTVQVSSLAAENGVIDFDDLMGEKAYKPWKAYNQSKLAVLMFALELHRRLQGQNRAPLSVAAHPGGASTNLGNNVQAGPLFRFFGKYILLPLLPSAEKGAWSQQYAATMPDVNGGEYYGPDGYGQYFGYPRKISLPQAAQQPGLWKKLWEVSEELVGQRFDPS